MWTCWRSRPVRPSSGRAVVDGVMRSLETGFVYTSHDMGERLIDDAYAHLRTFFELPAEAKQEFVAAGTHGQTGYTGLLVETAATSDVPDWKEMLNWSRDVPAGHPLRRKYPHRYMDQVIPDVAARHARGPDASSTSRSRTSSGAFCASSPSDSERTRTCSSRWSARERRSPGPSATRRCTRRRARRARVGRRAR